MEGAGGRYIKNAISITCQADAMVKRFEPGIIIFRRSIVDFSSGMITRPRRGKREGKSSLSPIKNGKRHGEAGARAGSFLFHFLFFIRLSRNFWIVFWTRCSFTACFLTCKTEVCKYFHHAFVHKLLSRSFSLFFTFCTQLGKAVCFSKLCNYIDVVWIAYEFTFTLQVWSFFYDGKFIFINEGQVFIFSLEVVLMM